MEPQADTPAREFLDLYGTEAWGDWQRLLTHFDLASGSLFLVLLLPGAVGADICRRQLAGHLQVKGKRLEILPCTERDEARRLGDRLFDLESTDDLGGVWIGSVIPESDREIELWKEAWRHGLSALNQHRNPLLRRFKCPLVLVGAPWLQPLLREAAPDLWSVRSAVVNVVAAPDPREKEFEPPGFRAESMAPPEMMGIAAADPDYAVERAESLRGKPGSELARAQLLLRAGNGFYQHERMEPAERCFRESIDLFEALESKPIEVQHQMAGALNNLATTLRRLGKREGALATAEEAVRIREQLAKTQPDVFLPDLASSLNNLANSLSELGRREKALAKAEEAVRIYEQLAKARPDTYLTGLATSLNNLAIMLGELGRREEALARAEQAMWIYEPLAKARPDAFLPSLAGSLHNLANRLSELGRREEALARAGEAVRIYEQLTKARPDTFLPGLAMSLQNLAARLNELGRPEGAQARAEEAVRIYEQLAKARPDAFLPGLAMSLNNLTNSLSKLGRWEEALARAEEAVRIREQLAKARPESSLPDLAGSLTNLANSLSELGRREEALARAGEAVRIYESLAKARPDVFLPGLATSFGSHGRVRSGLGNHLEAATSFVQGIRALLPLFQKTPQAFAPLMGLLCGDYIQACEQAKLEPDAALLSAVEEVQERLKTSGT